MYNLLFKYSATEKKINPHKHSTIQLKNSFLFLFEKFWEIARCKIPPVKLDQVTHYFNKICIFYDFPKTLIVVSNQILSKKILASN